MCDPGKFLGADFIFHFIIQNCIRIHLTNLFQRDFVVGVFNEFNHHLVVEHFDLSCFGMDSTFHSLIGEFPFNCMDD